MTGINGWLILGLMAGISMIVLILIISRIRTSYTQEDISLQSGPCIYDDPPYGKGHDIEQYYHDPPREVSWEWRGELEVRPDEAEIPHLSITSTITIHEPHSPAKKPKSRFEQFEP